MVIRSFDGATPSIHESAYVDETAVVIGDVVLGRDASVWPNSTLRGDDGRIHIGAETSVQDNCVFHEGADVGTSVTVGHAAVVHGCVVGDDCLIGMGSTVLTGAEIGEGSVVAAGAVVREEQTVPPRTLVAGVPAEPVRDLADAERGSNHGEDEERYYVRLAREHRRTSEPIDRSELA